MNMKLTLRGILSILMTMTLMTSCLEETMHEVENDVVNEESLVSYTAYVDTPDTKTVMNDLTSVWQGNEWIQVVGRNGNYWMGANLQGKSSSAVFTYNGENGKFNETDVLAIYPAGDANYGKNFDDLSVSGVTIPVHQTATVDSYDPNAAVTIAYSKNKTLQFKNVVSLLKFTMGSDGVKNVTVWGDMTETTGGALPDFYQDGNIYLTVHSDWTASNARFAAYFWKDEQNYAWVDMTKVSGQQNMYTCAVPSGSTNVIFCRMNPAQSSNGWDKDAPLWNQTTDLSLVDGNHFTIMNPWDSEGNDGKATGSWSSFSDKSTDGIAGSGTVYYNDGVPFFEGASSGYVSLSGDFKKGKTYYIAVDPVVFEKGMTVEFSYDGSNKFPVRKYNKRVELKRNTVHEMGTIRSTQETGFTTDPIIPNADQPCTIYYKPASGDDLYGHTGDLYAHIWLRTGTVDSNGSQWGDNSDKYKFTKVSGESNLWSLELTPTIREWFGIDKDTPCWKIGIIARSSSKQTGDNFIKVVDDLHESTEMPEGLHHGINYIDNSTVTLVLYDKDNQGKSHDFCNLLWDDNWWGYEEKPKKPLVYDADSGCWWVTLTDLNPNKQYKFQYQLGYGNNVTVHTFDPYTEIVYDRSNDEWISSYTYPDLAQEYGDTHGGRDNGFVSAFKINRDIYDWKVKNFKVDDPNDLIIYELHLRDFTDNTYGEGSIKAAMGQLDYLKTLGVNVVELMPIQEFEGNDSWGYGSHAYFALDKAYGTRMDYKKFIDACHERGIAVFLDVAYNHATGAHPYAAMYWNGDRTATNNPWFNEYAPHQWSVYHDWNHSNPMVRDHVKKSLEYLLTEYKVDGFRFDLSKGFTQNSGTEGCYDESRVGYLKEYNYHIKCINPNAVMICEHFVDDENWALGGDGIKVWRNMNHPYSKAMKRDMSQSDFSGVTQGFDNGSGMQNDNMAFGTLVGYMESHDEQRTNYEGQWSYDGSSIPFATRMERAKANAAFFLLVPGPKMIWQFGEIGYDINIEDNGRTGKKPCKTNEYINVPERKALYDTYSKLIAFRKKNHRLFDYDVNFRWYVGGGEQTGRYMFATQGGKTIAVFANFGTGTQTIGVELPSDGEWYQYDDASKVWYGRNHAPQMAEGQFYVLVNDRGMCL